MEAQDKLILSSLSRMGYPLQQDTVIESLDFDSLVPICHYFLKKMGEDLPPVKTSQNMGQRYKIATPLVEKMRSKGITFEVTLLLNPTPADIRNMLLELLSKSEFSGKGGSDGNPNLTLAERVQAKKKQINRSVLDQFLQDEWIHPTFLAPKRHVFRRISSPVTLNLEEEGECIIDCLREQLPRAHIVGSITNYFQAKTKKQAQAKISLKQENKVEISSILNLNHAEYQKYVAVERYQKREERDLEEETGGINVLTNFETSKKTDTANLDETAETKENLSPEEIEKRRVEDFRKKRKGEIDELTEQLDRLQNESKTLKKTVVEIQEKSSSLKQETTSLKEKNDQIAKELKAKDVILNSLASQDVLKAKRIEIKEMEQEMEELEQTWKEACDELTLSFNRAKRQFDEKRTELEKKQEKIDFYEENYSKLVQELKAEIANRENLINEYQRMPKDTKREHLSQMIEETKERCKENEQATTSKQQDLKSLEAALVKLEEEIKYLNKEINNRIGEGEDKKKKDDKSFDKLRATFDKLTKINAQTKQYMDKFVEFRLKNRQLQDRIMTLKRNRYQEISEKLKQDLAEIDNQN